MKVHVISQELELESRPSDLDLQTTNLYPCFLTLCVTGGL